MDQMNETTKILMEEQERIKGHVNLWETQLKKMDKEEHNFVDECRRRNNILIFRIEECLQESYFDTLKITEGVLRMKLKVGISSWNIERFCILGKKRGGRPFLVRFVFYFKLSPCSECCVLSSG
jgi:hypothetical protein